MTHWLQAIKKNVDIVTRVTCVFGMGDWVVNGKGILHLGNGKKVEHDPYLIDLQH